MAIDISTNNYLEDCCTEFVNKHITKPVLELGENELKSFLQEYLNTKGYAKDRVEKAP